MTVAPFAPKFMKVGVLTAALQELTPREVRDADPDRAIEDWLAFARDLGADDIQLSAALHPSEADVPPDAMLDPVANTLDLRQPFDRVRAARVKAAVAATGIGISDLAYFDNLLHHDAATRRRKHDFVRRLFDAAALLGVDAVCGFVGRNQQRSMDENLVDFEDHFVPLLQAAKARGLTYRVEQCPMPGWTTGDNWHNNIAYTPGAWIALHRICERHGVGDQFRIHYDPSHAILMGQDTRSIFQYLKDAGYGFLIGGFHVKGQVIDAAGVAAWGYGGQTLERGDWVAGSRRPGLPTSSTRGRSRSCCASTNCRAPRATTRSRTCKIGPWTGSITSSPRASCCRSTRRRRIWSSSTNILPRASRSGIGSRRSCRDRWRSSAGSTKRRRACTRCSTRCCRHRGFRCREPAARPIGAER